TVDVHERHLRASLEQHAHRRQAQGARRAGDDRRLAGQDHAARRFNMPGPMKPMRALAMHSPPWICGPSCANRTMNAMAERTSAEFRFYEELNDFLPEERRKRDFPIEIDRARSVKDAIESAGVPHTEVD